MTSSYKGPKLPREIYFVRPSGFLGPIKIGATKNVERRMAELNNWSPYPLELLVSVPGDLGLERNIQDCFADDHSHQEWFRPSDRLLKFIASIRAGTPVEVALDLKDRRGTIVKTRWDYYRNQVVASGEAA